MARRILNRKELRANYEAAELRKPSGEESDEIEDDEDEGEEEEAAAETDAEAGEEEEKAAPKKRKAAKTTKPKTRSRSQKVTRQKMVWGVFNNSHQRVAVFDYPKRRDADELAAKLTADKKSTHFVQPVKEPIDEKKEA
jgi:hypothetical protein